MGIKTKLENGKLIIFPEGRIDTSNAMEVEREMFQLAYEHANTPIEVDAKRLEYISSSGLRIFLVLRKAASQNGGTVIVRSIGRDIRNVFMMTGFLNLFQIED